MRFSSIPDHFPAEGNGNSLQYSCPENLMDRGAWWATVHGVAGARHNLASKPPPPPGHFSSRVFGPII